MTLKLLPLHLAFFLSPLVPATLAQNAAPAAKSDAVVYRTVYLTNVSQVNDGNEIFVALRNTLSPDVKMTYLPSQQAITIRGTSEQINLAQTILHDLDRPRKPYRLTYTLTEMEGGKRIGTQHFAVVVLVGGRTTLKQGSKVPIATGTYAPTSSPTSGTQTQFTYLDVGLNIDASLDEGVDGVRLRTKIEQSGIAEQTSGLGPGDPIVRQTVLEGTSILVPGKPIILGSLDIPSTTRHLDIEVVLEGVR